MTDFKIINGKLLKTTLNEPINVLTIPNIVERIEDYGLDITSNINKYNESVKKIVIPSSLSSCSLKAFKGFVNLQEIEVSNNSQSFTVYKDMLLSKNKGRIYLASKKISGVVNIDWALQVNLADYAFEYCKKITKIDLSKVTTSLGDFCFYHCENLEEINLPYALPNFDLGKGILSDCYKVKSIRIPKNISIVPEFFAQNCYSLESVRISDRNKNISIISRNAFCNCLALRDLGHDTVKHSNLELEGGLTLIEENAFSNCKSLIEATLLSKKITINDNAFNGCDQICFSCYKNSDVERFVVNKGFRYYLIEE